MGFPENTENRRRAVEMKLKGLGNHAIAAVLGVTHPVVAKYLRSEFKKLAKLEGGVEAQRARELTHLCALREKLLLYLDMATNIKASVALTRELRELSKRISLLQGLDAPAKIKVMPDDAPWLNLDEVRKSIANAGPVQAPPAGTGPLPGEVADRPALGDDLAPPGDGG